MRASALNPVALVYGQMQGLRLPNARTFCRRLRERLGATGEALDDLYKLDIGLALHEADGAAMMEQYNFSILALVKDAYPQHPWQPWRFANQPNKWWNNMDAQQEFMECLRREKNLHHSNEQLYSLTTDVVCSQGGARLLQNYYNYSIPSMVMTIYPEHSWRPWKFNHTPLLWWKDKNNQRKFVEYLLEELNLKTMEDLYSLNVKTITEHGGRTMLQCLYHESPCKFIMNLFPNHTWLPWKFHRVPEGWWDNQENQLKFTEWLREMLHLSMEDLYGVTCEIISKHGGALLLHRYSSWSKAIMSVYPEHNWQLWRFRVKEGWMSLLEDPNVPPKRREEAKQLVGNNDTLVFSRGFSTSKRAINQWLNEAETRALQIMSKLLIAL